MLVTSDGRFQVLITAGTTSFQQFQEDVLAKCNKQFEDSGELISNLMATRSPRVDWKISMKLKGVDEFKKSASYTINVSLGLNSENRTQVFGGHFYMYFSRRREIQ
jgi:hypothetical protein